MNVLILGYGRHGKDSFAEFLERVSNRILRFCSSSEFCAEKVVFPVMIQDGNHYFDYKHCFYDRHNHRVRWHQIIRDYNRPDATRLARAIFENHDLYVGMRSLEEYQAGVKANLFDVVYWIDRSEHCPPEPADSCDLHYDPETMILINNNGDLKSLQTRALVGWRTIKEII